jgi:hypothetical protein
MLTGEPIRATGPLVPPYWPCSSGITTEREIERRIRTGNREGENKRGWSRRKIFSIFHPLPFFVTYFLNIQLSINLSFPSHSCKLQLSERLYYQNPILTACLLLLSYVFTPSERSSIRYTDNTTNQSLGATALGEPWPPLQPVSTALLLYWQYCVECTNDTFLNGSWADSTFNMPLPSPSKSLPVHLSQSFEHLNRSYTLSTAGTVLLNLCMVYLTILSVSQNVHNRIIRW